MANDLLENLNAKVGSFVERYELLGWKEKQWNNGKSK